MPYNRSPASSSGEHRDNSQPPFQRCNSILAIVALMDTDDILGAAPFVAWLGNSRLMETNWTIELALLRHQILYGLCFRCQLNLVYDPATP